MTRIIYGIVIAVLSVTAIVVGLIAASNKATAKPDDSLLGDNSQITDGENNENPEGENENAENKEEQKVQATLAGSFISPVVGTVYREHSLSVPVFSETLLEWRVHTGIDVMTAEGAEVFAAASGVVEKAFADPLFGYTVIIRHTDTVTSVYSNLDEKEIAVSVGDEIERGAFIGKVGDSSVSELADEAHLHFEVRLNGAAVNPFDYLSKEAKESSLGIKEEAAA